MTGQTDKLDHTLYAEKLMEIISNPKTKTPLTVGLFATWGRGKTSTIELIEEQIEGHNKPKKVFIKNFIKSKYNLIKLFL